MTQVGIRQKPNTDLCLEKGEIINGGGDVGDNRYLTEPAKKDGVIVIGAGTNPKERAYNIDKNPTVEGVYYGDANDLSNVATNSQKKVIMENPYGFDPLNSEIVRITQGDGTIVITGSQANKYVNKTEKNASNAGLTVVDKSVIDDTSKFKNSSGAQLKGKELVQYTLKKEGGI